MVELRFRGQLLGHFANDAAARACIEETAQHAHDDSRAAHVADHAIAPRKPIELFVMGNLVDTFDAKADAVALADAIDSPGIEIVDRRKGEMTRAELVTTTADHVGLFYQEPPPEVLPVLHNGDPQPELAAESARPRVG